MNRSYFKPILAGVLLGAALFYMPFLIKMILLFVIMGGLIRFIVSRKLWHYAHAGAHGGEGKKGNHGHYRAHFRGFRGGWGPWFHPAFAEKIRNMSDEEYNRFKEKFQSRWTSHCGDWEETTAPEQPETKENHETTPENEDN